jgi:anti-sigma B factor antagonist
MDDLVGMQVEQADGDVVVVRLTGELDIATAERMGRQIAEAVPSTARGVVIDMTHLGFMDSSGVSMLFGLARRVGSRRQELRVVAVPGHPVARVLEIVEFERAAPVHRDVSSAVAEIVKRGSQQPRG